MDRSAKITSFLILLRHFAISRIAKNPCLYCNGTKPGWKHDNTEQLSTTCVCTSSPVTTLPTARRAAETTLLCVCLQTTDTNPNPEERSFFNGTGTDVLNRPLLMVLGPSDVTVLRQNALALHIVGIGFQIARH
jgi:hypothetical protein